MNQPTDREIALVEAARALLSVQDRIDNWPMIHGTANYTLHMAERQDAFRALSTALTQYQEPPLSEQCPSHPGHRCPN